MADKIKTDDLPPDQERLLRELIKKEMLKKIEGRIDSEDSNVLKSIKNLMDEEPAALKNADKKMEKIKERIKK